MTIGVKGEGLREQALEALAPVELEADLPGVEGPGEAERGAQPLDA